MRSDIAGRVTQGSTTLQNDHGLQGMLFCMKTAPTNQLCNESVLCRSYDGATNVELFAFYPAAEVVAILGVYYPTLGLDTLQVELLQGYLYWVALEFIVPTALFGGPTGQLLGPAAGGLLVNRSVSDWINGTLQGDRL